MSGRVANRNFSRAFRWQRAVIYWIIALGAWLAITYFVHIVGWTLYDPETTEWILLFGLYAIVIGMAYSIGHVSYYVFRATMHDRGVFYAAFYSALIVILIPAFFAGVFTIPTLLNGDAIRRRNWDREHGMREI